MKTKNSHKFTKGRKDERKYLTTAQGEVIVLKVFEEDKLLKECYTLLNPNPVIEYLSFSAGPTMISSEEHSERK